MGQAFQNQHAGALTNHTAFPASIKRATGLLRHAVAHGQHAHGFKAAHHHRRQRGFAAAANHHLRITAPNRLGGLANRISAGRAGRHRRHAGPFQPHRN